MLGWTEIIWIGLNVSFSGYIDYPSAVIADVCQLIYEYYKRSKKILYQRIVIVSFLVPLRS
jgi:hypothetical protein